MGLRTELDSQKPGEDALDGREADEAEEPREEEHDRQAHLLGGRLGGCLGLGELVGAQRRRLGAERGAHLGAFGAGQADAGGQLAQLGDAELVPRRSERRPRRLASKSGRVEAWRSSSNAQPSPTLAASRGRSRPRRRRRDAMTTRSRKLPSAWRKSRRRASASAWMPRSGSTNPPRPHNAASPQRQRQRKVVPAEARSTAQAGTSRSPKMPRATFSARWRSVLRPSTARSRRTRGQTRTPAPARVSTSAIGRPTRAANAAAIFGGEHGWRLGRAAQLGERFGQGWPRRGDAPGHQEQPGADAGTAEQARRSRARLRADELGEEPRRFGRPGHLGQPGERRREQPADEEQHELADAAAVGGEVAVVQHGEEQSKAERDARR